MSWRPLRRSGPVEANIATRDGKTTKLMLGDNTPSNSSTYAMIGGDSRLFTVASSIKTTLDKPAPSFADKKLFSFGFDFPKQVEMKLGGKSYAIAYNGDDWKVNGTRMDATSVQSVIARIRDLEGTGFVATGAGKKDVEFTITAADGKRMEHVELTKSGKDYIGRRDNRPALYVVSDTLIADLQKYIDEIKPYVAPAETSPSATPPTTTNIPSP